jgi:hypothetical protein
VAPPDPDEPPVLLDPPVALDPPPVPPLADDPPEPVPPAPLPPVPVEPVSLDDEQARGASINAKMVARARFEPLVFIVFSNLLLVRARFSCLRI